MQYSRNIALSLLLRSLPILSILSVVVCLNQVARGDTNTVYENYTFITLAGPGNVGPGALDGPTNVARLNGPNSIARDNSGNFYVADSHNNTIRKIAPNGSVSTLAGLAGVAGTNDGLGAAARFNQPFGVAVDNVGNVYVSDSRNHTIRKISSAGAVTTFAGAPGVFGTANGTGAAAHFKFPNGIVLDGNNNLYVADTANDVIRKITPTGAVTTFAGTMGTAGASDGNAASARFTSPVGIAMDLGTNIYVADAGNDTIRKITPKGVVSTLAGLVRTSGGVDGTNGTARFNTPENLTVDSQTNVYVTDTFNNTIRKITPDGVVVTLVGIAGFNGIKDGVGTNASFQKPIGIAVDPATNLYVAEFQNNTVRRISPDSNVTTFVGLPLGQFGTNDGPAAAARFEDPSHAVVDGAGNIYVADQANSTIRKITSDGIVSTFAGTPTVTGTNDGTGTSASFNKAGGLAFDTSGNLIVADTFNHTIRQITPQGAVSTLAGVPGVIGTNDGSASTTNWGFNEPFFVAVDSSNNIFVADTHNDAIREVLPDGSITTFAGQIGIQQTNDGVGTNAMFAFPEGLAFDANDTLFVVDDFNFTIRKIAPDATVTTFAGTPKASGSSDGVGNSARFNFPFGDAVDTNGNIYVADNQNQLIRKITPAGSVTTIAGVLGQTGDEDGTGSGVLFNGPEGLFVDNQGNVYLADSVNQSIRKGYPALPDTALVDRIGAPAGVTRNFSISNQTTTSWSWSLIRRPSGSAAEISGTNTANPTFTPDVEDIYVVQFQGWDNSGKTAFGRITLYADSTPPGISITNPAAGQTTSNGLFTVQGIATDNLGVSNVWVQINGGPFVLAGGEEIWSNDLALVTGTNIIRAYAEDFAGQRSSTNQVNLRYIPGDRLKVQRKGAGSIKPNLDGLFLALGTNYTMTAKAVPGATFSNWTASIGSNAPFLVTNSSKISFAMQSNLTLTANFNDFQGPTVLFTSPKNGQFASNSFFTVFGTAKDNDQVTNVSFDLNGGGFNSVRGTANWFTNITLVPGTNVLSVYAVDPSGNISATNRVTVNYVVSSRLFITMTGQGTLTPNYNGAVLAIGTNYTMTAKANPGYFFSNWVDSASNVLSTSPTLSFVMQSNTLLGVNFTTNVMFRASGSYAGLFMDTNNVTATNAGFFSATVTPTGSFSAKLLFHGTSIPASGQFSPDGFYSNSVPIKNASPLSLQMQLDLTGQSFVSGSVGGDGWSVPLLANQLVFNLANPPSQQFQRLSLVMPGNTADSSSQPGGYSYGFVTIDNLGTVTLTGGLADGNVAAQKTFISRDGQWPFYISSDSGNGIMLGWLLFGPGQNGTLDGHVYWETEPFAAAKVYPGGFDFTNGIDAVGSVLNFFKGKPSLVLTNSGKVVLQQAGISPPLTNYFDLNANDSGSSTNGLKLSITWNTGIFKGTAFDPIGNVSIPINGVVLSNTNAAFGYFINGGQSGSVLIGQ